MVYQLYRISNGVFMRHWYANRYLCVCVQDEEDQGREFGRGLDGEESATEQTHHIIIPSYASWFDYNW